VISVDPPRASLVSTRRAGARAASRSPSTRSPSESGPGTLTRTTETEVTWLAHIPLMKIDAWGWTLISRPGTMVDSLTRGGCQGTTTASILDGADYADADGGEVRWPAPQNHPTSKLTFSFPCQPEPNGVSTEDDRFSHRIAIPEFRRTAGA
jgi:hypothetical protein